MKNFVRLAIGLALFATAATARADDPKDQQAAKDAAAFAERMFAGNVDKDKSYACFVRVYDAAHLRRHPLQKVAAMKLLVTAEPTEQGQPGLTYSFRLGVKFTKRPGDFDSSGTCSRLTVESQTEMKTTAHFACGVDCDGGGITVELTKENVSTLVRLENIRIWQNNKPDDEGLNLSGGADDKIFRLDRTRTTMCKSLITDRKERAAIRTLKK